MELSATEQIAVALRKEMTDSGFAPGDRISASGMAQRLGLGPSTVRTAMRQLADDGLLARSDRGFQLPLLTGADVIDLYASRLHVGMVILRACAAQPKHRLLPARLVSDNRRILTAVLEGRAEEAVRIWRSKQDNAVRHMSAQAPDTFDAALWDRLTH